MKTIDRRLVLGVAAGAWAAVFLCGASVRVLADCASYRLPFTDLGAEPGFCAAIAEAYSMGITNGTSATTFDPAANVTREQAAVFLTRTLDAGLTRGSRRAALGQWWTTTPRWDLGFGLTAVGSSPAGLASDGADIWVADSRDGTVSRVRASDGRLLETWTGADHAAGILAAMGRIFVTGFDTGNLYMIDPSQPAGAVETVAHINADLTSLVFDGAKIWILSSMKIWVVQIGTWTVTAVPSADLLTGIVFDGANVWVASSVGGYMERYSTSGEALQAVAVGSNPRNPLFDGTNLWVPNLGDDSITVVNARSGSVVRTILSGGGNALKTPVSLAFDGQRIVVINVGLDSASRFVSLFKATDLSFIGKLSAPGVAGACSDGVNFWFSFPGKSAIGRF